MANKKISELTELETPLSTDVLPIVDMSGTPVTKNVEVGNLVTKTLAGLGNVTNDAQLKASDLDTDGALTANSDTKIPSQKAVKTYADTKATKGANTDITSIALTGSINPTNLLSNGDFESWSAGTSAAPDGWTLELTPTVARDTGDVGYGSYSVKITGNGAALEGIKFTTGTLKPSTKYTLSIRVKATAGDTASIKTTGATTNLDLESTSETFETKIGTLITDGSGTPVVIKLLAKADGDIVWFDGVHLCEGESAFAFSPKPAEEGVWTDYSSTSTIVGWSNITRKQIYTKRIGKTVFFHFYIYGTSDNVATNFTLPYTAKNVPDYFSGFMYAENAGTVVTTGANWRMTQGSATINCYSNTATGAWTASGAKAIRGQGFYETE